MLFKVLHKLLLEVPLDVLVKLFLEVHLFVFLKVLLEVLNKCSSCFLTSANSANSPKLVLADRQTNHLTDRHTGLWSCFAAKK